MPIFASFDQILSFAPTAFQAQPAFPDYRTALPPPAPPRHWRLTLSIAAGAVALILLLSHAAPVTPVTELAWLRDLAAHGDAGAQLQLGLAYRDGRYGLTPDARSAFTWLKRAAAGGEDYAADLVGTAYAQGIGTGRDMNAARHWWRVAADAGNADAARQLGSREHQSLADAWDLIVHGTAFGQSRHALLRRAQDADPVAEYQLGMRYRDGAWDVNRDPDRAEYWLQRAADDGSRLAQHALAERPAG